MRLLISLLLGSAALPTLALGAWSNGYTYRRTITVDHTKVSTGNQTDFPVYVALTPATVGTSFGSHVTSGFGYDILFTSDAAGAVPLGWDFEYYVGANNLALAHVDIPVLSASVDTVFYVFYGNATVTTPQSLNQWGWNTGYVGVFHFPDGLTLDVDDSTSIGIGGTAVGGPTPSLDGMIDGSMSLVSASNQYVTIGNHPPSPVNLTVSAWVKATSFPNALNTIIAKDDVGVGSFSLYVTNTGTLSAFSSGGQTTAGSHTLTAGVWYYITMTYDSAITNHLWVYVNGAVDQTVDISGGLTTNNATASIGNDLTNLARGWNGLIDEVRISNVARTASWIATEYNNQSSPSTFLTVGAETTGSSAPVSGRRRVIVQQ